MSLLLLFDEDAVALLDIPALRFTHEQLAAAHGLGDTFVPSIAAQAGVLRGAVGTRAHLRHASGTYCALHSAGGTTDALA